MWEHDNQTPFAADHSWIRDKDGAEVWVVAVKATFLVRPDGTTEIAPEQVPVTLVPQYRGDPAASSLLYDSDVYHTKPTTEVLLNGHAYAPGDKPATQVDVTMKVGPIKKTLRVTGDRVWKIGALTNRASEPKLFEKMPLIYERAYGGREEAGDDPTKQNGEVRNPVGVGFATSPGNLADKPLPNVEDPRNLIGLLRMQTKPAGFGPIAPHWQPRVKWGGTYGDKWLQERQPLLPEDFDERFYLSAPEDQQAPAYLKGGEPVELVNLTPGGVLIFPLPRLAFGFQTRFSRGEVVRHRAKLHTVILEPDVPRVLMVWHTHLPCHPRVLKLQRTTITQKQVLASVGGEPLDEEAE
ncbi:MAG: DUF2169 domain-containing protein [Planctomycetes bacterium]|nr:DUF2169 domain-containing protein [Planctomycetota bacterium]